MLRPTIDTIAPVTEGSGIDSYATTPGVLWARVAPGEASSFTLFDGAKLGQERAGDTILLTSEDGDEFDQGVVFEVTGVTGKPGAVADNDGLLAESDDLDALQASLSGWLWLPERNGTLYVKVGGGSHAISVGPSDQ